METVQNLEHEKQRRLEDKIYRELGKEVVTLLNEKGIEEIMVNPDGRLWMIRFGSEEQDTGITIPTEKIRALIMVVANLLEQPITQDRPYVEGILPFNGSRFEGLLPPIVYSPCYTIRKKPEKIYTLDDYLTKKIITAEQKQQIENAVVNRHTILVTGGTGSGKSTLANAILNAIHQLNPKHRIVTLEDTDELLSSSDNVVNLFTSDHVDMRKLLKITMRLRPDRIIVGEVRDGAALDMIKAWNTGHPGGVATIHANSIEDSYLRLEQMISEVTTAPMRQTIENTIDTIIHITRHPDSSRSIELKIN